MEKEPFLEPDMPEQENLSPDETATELHEEDNWQPASFTIWRGLQTAIGAAFILATLFTLWTPGSLISTSLEARMAQALELMSSDEEVVFEEALDTEEDEEEWERLGIVAGHYGYDSGAVCANGVTEVELNLRIATLVQKKLTDLGFQVDLLEEFDSRLHGYQGALVLSIHLDSCEFINDQATGFKVAPALSSRDAEGSQRFTRCLSTRYGDITGLPYHAGSVTDDMTYYHAFNEVDPGTIAAIIEAGFMNMDYRIITEETDRVADGIVAGILCYLNDEVIDPIQSP